jgi:hypothetical protein
MYTNLSGTLGASPRTCFVIRKEKQLFLKRSFLQHLKFSYYLHAIALRRRGYREPSERCPKRSPSLTFLSQNIPGPQDSAI